VPADVGGDEHERKWRKGAVIYGIYPRALRATNDDGAGDVPGIISDLRRMACETWESTLWRYARLIKALKPIWGMTFLTTVTFTGHMEH
jgi:hypothetical protein